MELAHAAAIRMPFPHDESYDQVVVRMRGLLEELAAKRDGQQVLLIGHSATRWMLDHWLWGQPSDTAVGMLPERP